MEVLAGVVDTSALITETGRELSDEEINRRTGIEEDVIAEVRQVLASEFED
jgi:hypothetical protein